MPIYNPSAGGGYLRAKQGASFSSYVRPAGVGVPGALVQLPKNTIGAWVQMSGPSEYVAPILIHGLMVTPTTFSVGSDAFTTLYLGLGAAGAETQVAELKIPTHNFDANAGYVIQGGYYPLGTPIAVTSAVRVAVAGGYTGSNTTQGSTYVSFVLTELQDTEAGTL